VLHACADRKLDLALWIFGAFAHGQARALAISVAAHLSSSKPDFERASIAYRVLIRKLGSQAAADAALRDHCGIFPRLRPGGRPAEEARACALAAIRQAFRLSRQDLLVGLKLADSKTTTARKTTPSDSPAWGWFSRALDRGDYLLQRARPGLQSDVSLIALLARVHADEPRVLVDALLPYLSEPGVPGVFSDQLRPLLLDLVPGSPSASQPSGPR
jgi:hypothetical protein